MILSIEEKEKLLESYLNCLDVANCGCDYDNELCGEGYVERFTNINETDYEAAKEAAIENVLNHSLDRIYSRRFVVSNCCEYPIVENSDICGKCGDHCGSYIEDEIEAPLEFRKIAQEYLEMKG